MTLTPAVYRAGKGEPLVMLHGFTGTWQHWRPVLGDLAARFDVIAPTLAGHAGGPPFPVGGPLTLEAATDHLETHLDELGVGTAHVAGNSMGGALALELAKRGRARSIVALSPGGGWEPGSPEPKRIARFFARQTKIAKATVSRAELIMRRPLPRKLAYRDIMRHGELMAPADAVAMQRASVDCEVIGHVLHALRDGDDARLKGLDAITCPVLLAWAAHDRVLPEPANAPRLRREIPGVEYRVLGAVGHVPMWDDARLVAETISTFVERHAGGSQVAPDRAVTAAA